MRFVFPFALFLKEVGRLRREPAKTLAAVEDFARPQTRCLT
jgi:hypothetical protein